MMSEDFEVIPREVQIQIDEAFDAAVGTKSRTSLASPFGENRAVNLIVGDNPGGFVLPSDDEHPAVSRSEDDLILLSLIPTALQILDLPPDDDEVLQIFRNAAGGWTSAEGSEGAFREAEGGVVTRKDWRAVCSVLLADRTGEIESDKLLMDDTIPSGRESVVREGEDDSEDVYQEISSDSVSNDYDPDSDEYLEDASDSEHEPKPNSSKSKSAHMAKAHETPTPRQMRSSLDAFALFFPSSPRLSDTELVTKRLTFTDIARVAGVLKEKLKAEEITEMLSYFSSSPDGSITFNDFTRIMIMAKVA